MSAGTAWILSAAIHMLLLIAVMHNEVNPFFSYAVGALAGMLTAAFMFVSWVEQDEDIFG